LQYIIAQVDEYDPHRLGVPWAAPSDSSGRPNFKGKVGHYTGLRGSAGDLLVEGSIAEGAVWICGQKDYRLGRSTKAYLQFRNGEFHPLSADAVAEALRQAPQISSDDARRDELIGILLEELVCAEAAQTVPSLCDIMAHRGISQEELSLYSKKEGDSNG